MSEIELHPLQRDDGQTSVMGSITTLINQYIDNIINREYEAVKKTFQITYTYGSDLDNLALLYSLTRIANEDDEHFRNRITAAVLYRTPGTKTAIKDYFNAMFGFRPLIVEDFDHQFYSAGDTIPDLRVGEFQLLMPLNLTRVQEKLLVNTGGVTVTLTHLNVNTAAPNAEAYYYDDVLHSTDYAGALDADGVTLNLTGGPHALGQPMYVYYDIIPDELFDTFQETIDALALYEASVERMKVAGVKSDVAYYWQLGSWFHGNTEEISITETSDPSTWFQMGFLEDYLEANLVDTTIFFTADFTTAGIIEFLNFSWTDSANYCSKYWGTAKWGQSKWEQNWLFLTEDSGT